MLLLSFLWVALGSIHIILGKPGSGKSLYAVMRLVQELREGSRNIVTNLPLHLGRLNEYLQQKYPNENLRVVQRVRILNDDELREFWKYRGPAAPLEGFPADMPPFQFRFQEGAVVDAEFRRKEFEEEQYQCALRDRELRVADWINRNGTQSGDNGVAYFLDEAHIAFNAREWASLGRSCLHYLSQHRKLGDLVFPITQSPGNLDKQFRSVAEDFTTMRNEYVAKFGPFRGPGRFKRKVTLGEPGPHSEPFETATFTLDKEGIASCYDTARGIGVHGSKADIGRRAKGISLYWVFPMAGAVALLCVLLPWGIAKGIGKTIGGKKNEIEALAKGMVSPAKEPSSRVEKSVPVPVPADTSRKEPEPPLQTKSEPPSNPWRGVFIKGYMAQGSRINVTLSDGRVITEDDGIVMAIQRDRVLLRDGSVLYMKEPVILPGQKKEAVAPKPGPVAAAVPVAPITITPAKTADGEVAIVPRGTSQGKGHYLPGRK